MNDCPICDGRGTVLARPTGGTVWTLTACLCLASAEDLLAAIGGVGAP